MGSITDRYVLALLLLLANVGTRRLRACPFCRSAFLRKGPRKQCGSAECLERQTAATLGKWKRSESGQEVLRRQRRRLYEKNGWTLGARTKAKKR